MFTFPKVLCATQTNDCVHSNTHRRLPPTALSIHQPINSHLTSYEFPRWKAIVRYTNKQQQKGNMYMKLYKRSQNLNSPSYYITYKIILRVFLISLKIRNCKEFFKCNSNPITCLDRSWRIQEFEAHRLQDNRHTKVVSLSTLLTGRLYTPGNIPGTHFY
jgi:hypothetical protein